MSTRFGDVVTSKGFFKVFFVSYLLFMCFAAYETGLAFYTLTGESAFYLISFAVHAVCVTLMIVNKRANAKRRSQKLGKVAGFLGCFFIYYMLALLPWKLICALVGTASRTNATGTVCALAVSALIVLAGYLHTKRIGVRKYTVPLGNTGETYRIALISDIHLGAFVGTKHVSRIVRKINALRPDLVLISGDILDGDNTFLDDFEGQKRISSILSTIKAKEGVYAVLGNHDPKVYDERLTRFLKESSIILLDNDTAALSKILLLGRTDAENNHREPISVLLKGTESSKPIVVLDHNPKGIDEAAEYGADLVLCGHTHKGQFFPVTLFTKWANGKKYFYGHQKFGMTHGIITSGAGFFQLPVRIGTSNEVVDIQLKL